MIGLALCAFCVLRKWNKTTVKLSLRANYRIGP